MGKALADRGKEAEAEVKKFLEKFNAQHATFDFERLPDARSARGRVAAQVADFAFYAPSIHGVIEVKETEHDYRLGFDRLTQWPKLLKRRQAGGDCILVVWHSTINRWRHFNLQDLQHRREHTDEKSWDFRDAPCFGNADGALSSAFACAGLWRSAL